MFAKQSNVVNSNSCLQPLVVSNQSCCSVILRIALDMKYNNVLAQLIKVLRVRPDFRFVLQVAPELQLTNESTVAGYLNFMQSLVAGSISDIVPDYSTLLILADSPAALVTEINTVMAAGQLSAATQTLIVSAINAMSRANDAAMRQRVNAAMLLVMAAPEFVVLK